MILRSSRVDWPKSHSWADCSAPNLCSLVFFMGCCIALLSGRMKEYPLSNEPWSAKIAPFLEQLARCEAVINLESVWGLLTCLASHLLKIPVAPKNVRHCSRNANLMRCSLLLGRKNMSMRRWIFAMLHLTLTLLHEAIKIGVFFDRCEESRRPGLGKPSRSHLRVYCIKLYSKTRQRIQWLQESKILFEKLRIIIK